MWVGIIGDELNWVWVFGYGLEMRGESAHGRAWT